MARKRKCNHGSVYFRFDMPIKSNGVLLGTLTVEGYGCNENNTLEADIDDMSYDGELKGLIEYLGGMQKVDTAAAEYVKDLFSISQVAQHQEEFA